MKKLNIYSVLASILAVCTLVGCTQEMVTPESRGVLNVSMESASNIMASQAALSGTIVYADTHPKDGEIELYFLLSRNADLSSAIRVEGECVHISANMDSCYARVFGLFPSYTYYYALCVTDGLSLIQGDTKSFITKKVDPEVISVPTESIDLGLSVPWAPWNVGACSPEDFGNYYAWGDTYVKMNYDEGTHQYKGVDVASVKWGNGWRMPTEAEFRELFTKCSFEWTSINGINGCKVTGPNGNSMFIPAAGYRKETSHLYCNSDGFYWSSTLNSGYVHCLSFGDEYNKGCSIESGTRYYGRPIRPVKGKLEPESKPVVVASKIDLGLSVKWASHNVGASDPGEYGEYYAWGEIKEKEDYTWGNYKWCFGSKETLAKYCLNDYYGIYDGKRELEPEDDVAHVKWGGGWRMPTRDEMEELYNECSWEWEWFRLIGPNGGSCGYRVTGPNGNSIFLPAAGYRNNYGLSNVGLYGLYWSSSLLFGGPDAYGFCFSSNNNNVNNGSERYEGKTIRPVCD